MTNLHLIGDYFIASTIGYGTTGQVKLGIHQKTGIKVAIKIIPRTQLDSSTKIKQAVERELAVLQLLNHPNLIELYQIIQDQQNIYFVMEYVSGGELYYILNGKKHHRLPEIEAREIFKQIADALVWCHAHHICHRDLKPENILLDEEKKKIKIADFGMAVMQPATKLLKTSCGSPHYASPEIVRGIPYYGPAADVWSAGVILYVLLTGRLPFDDRHVGRLLTKIKKGCFRQIPNWVSPAAKDLLFRMLVVDPNKRLNFNEILSHPWMISTHVSHKDSFLVHSPSLMVWNNDQLKYPLISNSNDLNGPTRETLKVLWRDLSHDQLVSALMEKSPNIQKLTYYLLQQKRQKRDSHSNKDLVYSDTKQMVAQQSITLFEDDDSCASYFTLAVLSPQIESNTKHHQHMKRDKDYRKKHISFQHLHKPLILKNISHKLDNTTYATCLHVVSSHHTAKSLMLLPFFPHHRKHNVNWSTTVTLAAKLLRQHTNYLTSMVTKVYNKCLSLFGSVSKKQKMTTHHYEERMISCFAKSESMAAGKLHFILSEHFQGYVNGYMYSDGKVIWYGKLDDSQSYHTNFICKIRKTAIHDDKKTLLYEITLAVHSSNSSIVDRLADLLNLYENDASNIIKVNNWKA
ncbi:MAG: kinase-like domain-containing protein [Benjaminiella poitrasii]|nr:MAG: kinase-like domain-containing protein [Benjaminiella poitrasii]